MASINVNGKALETDAAPDTPGSWNWKMPISVVGALLVAGFAVGLIALVVLIVKRTASRAQQ